MYFSPEEPESTKKVFGHQMYMPDLNSYDHVIACDHHGSPPDLLSLSPTSRQALNAAYPEITDLIVGALIFSLKSP
jgi:hypothetical protein